MRLVRSRATSSDTRSNQKKKKKKKKKKLKKGSVDDGAAYPATVEFIAQ